MWLDLATLILIFHFSWKHFRFQIKDRGIIDAKVGFLGEDSIFVIREERGVIMISGVRSVKTIENWIEKRRGKWKNYTEEPF